MPAKRDPISQWFDPAAVRLLERAYRNRDQWTGIYLAPPSIRQRAAAANIGIWNLGEVDRWGERRWTRAYKRSVYWHLKHFGYSDGLHVGDHRNSPYPAVALQWQTGNLVRLPGWPTRRLAIRVAIRPRSGAGYREAVSRAETSGRYWPGTDQQSTYSDRDWEDAAG